MRLDERLYALLPIRIRTATRPSLHSPSLRVWMRLNPHALPGLREGDAHVIRNAGGVITDDEIRSLSISQRLLGTEEIMLIHHTDCGMLTFSDDEFRRQVEHDTGIKPEWAAGAFDDLEDDLRQSIARIKASPFIPSKDHVRGFVYEVESGRLREVK
jgi:carbonic anhydrase